LEADQRDIGRTVAQEIGRIDELIVHTQDEIRLLNELRAPPPSPMLFSAASTCARLKLHRLRRTPMAGWPADRASPVRRKQPDPRAVMNSRPILWLASGCHLTTIRNDPMLEA
jgi:hypothetical protein